jgi:hypothetical protein
MFAGWLRKEKSMRTNNNMRNVDKIHWDRIADSPHITGRKLPNGRKGVGATHGESRFGTYDLSGSQGVWSEMFDAVFFTPRSAAVRSSGWAAS